VSSVYALVVTLIVGVDGLPDVLHQVMDQDGRKGGLPPRTRLPWPRSSPSGTQEALHGTGTRADSPAETVTGTSSARP
jgi:hypothetical protein